jgi:hypothetical protein
MNPIRLFAATGDAVAELNSLDGTTFNATFNLEGRGVMWCAALPDTTPP